MKELTLMLKMHDSYHQNVDDSRQWTTRTSRMTYEWSDKGVKRVTAWSKAVRDAMLEGGAEFQRQKVLNRAAGKWTARVGGGNVCFSSKRLKTGKLQQPQHGLQNSCSEKEKAESSSGCGSHPELFMRQRGDERRKLLRAHSHVGSCYT